MRLRGEGRGTNDNLRELSSIEVPSNSSELLSGGCAYSAQVLISGVARALSTPLLCFRLISSLDLGFLDMWI